jgi:hypothetical protein
MVFKLFKHKLRCAAAQVRPGFIRYDNSPRFSTNELKYHMDTFQFGEGNLNKVIRDGIKLLSLVWCPGQNKRIAPVSFLHGCRKRRLKDY